MIEGPYKAKRSRRISEYGYAFELIYLIVAFSLGSYFVGSLGSNYFFVGGLTKQAMLAILASVVIVTLRRLSTDLSRDLKLLALILPAESVLD